MNWYVTVAGAMSSVTGTMVFFGVEESMVDSVLEHLAERGSLPRRCVVFASNMARLGGLVEHWKARLEVIVVWMPGPGKGMVDAADTILANEGIEMSSTIWVHAGDLSAEWIAGASAVLDVGRLDFSDLAGH